MNESLRLAEKDSRKEVAALKTAAAVAERPPQEAVADGVAASCGFFTPLTSQLKNARATLQARLRLCASNLFHQSATSACRVLPQVGG